jgi:uncharacterized protein (TIGR03437 family)
VQVLFDGKPAALLYAGPSQINAIVPTAVAGRSHTVVQIATPSGMITGPTLIVQSTAPEVFVDMDEHAVAVNQDGTLNSPSNPAALGSIVAVFMIGAGAVPGGRPDDAIITGLSSNPFPISVLSTANAQGGLLSLEVLYGGDAPFAPSGLSQVNFRLPIPAQSLPPGANTLQFQIEAGSAVSDLFSIYVK